MKKNCLFLVLLLPLLINAQSILVSEDVPLRNDVAYELLGEIKGQTLLFRDRTNEFEVQGFDDRMRLSWTKEIELDKRLPKVIGVYSTQEDFTILYRFRQKGNTIVKAHRYDAAANLIDSVTVHNYGYLFYTPNFEVIRSEDKSKLLIFYIERQNIVRGVAFDNENMTTLWEKSFSPDDLNYFEEFRQILVDNEGNLRLVLEKDNFKSKRKTHYYEIHEYYGAEDELTAYNIPLEGYLTYDVYFSFDNLNKRLIAAGLYSEKNPAKAAGYFYLNIDPERPKSHLLNFVEFEDDFVSNLVGKEVDDNKGLIEVSVQEIVLRRDGGVLMIAERTRQLERRSAGATRVYYDGSSRFIVDYYYDELFVISIHPTGETHWKTILHKKQYSQDDDGVYSSYFLFKTPSNLRFLFNDEIRYENTVSEYVMNGLGEYDRNSILSTENLHLRLRFRDAIQVDADELIIPSERRNRLKLVKLEY